MYKMYKLIDNEFQLIHRFDTEDDLVTCEELYGHHYGEDLIVLMNNKPLSYMEIFEIVHSY